MVDILSELLARIATHPHNAEHLAQLRVQQPPRILALGWRDRGMQETVVDMLERRLFPIVDVQYGVIVGIPTNHHEAWRAHLYWLHTHAPLMPKRTPYAIHDAAKRFVTERYGYVFCPTARGNVYLERGCSLTLYDRETLLHLGLRSRYVG